MPKTTETPFVTIIPPSVTGNAYRLSIQLAEERIVRGNRLKNFESVKSYARIISNIIVNEQFDNPPSDTPKEVLEILGISVPRIERIALDLNGAWFDMMEAMGVKEGGTESHIGQSREEQTREFLNSMKALFQETRDLRTKVEQLATELDAAKSQTKKWREKAEAYEAIRIAEGKSIANIQKITVRKAIDNYQSTDRSKTGTRAGPRYRKTIKHILNRFVVKMGEKTILTDIPSSAIINYLNQRLERGLVPSTIRQEGVIILAMLDHQSGGLYPTKSVRLWMAQHIESQQRQEEDWVWLEAEQVDKLIACAAQAPNGQYWADAMRIQYELALRPEEIVMLQSSNVVRGPGRLISHVFLCPVMDGPRLIRKLKTENSRASLKVYTDIAREALERRLAKGNLFVFPRDPADCGGRRMRWCTAENADPFEIKNMLWRPSLWDGWYLARVRAAAKETGIIDPARIDSRTLRRSRGKQIVLTTLSMTAAAAFLRDNERTVRRSYAKLLPKDVA